MYKIGGIVPISSELLKQILGLPEEVEVDILHDADPYRDGPWLIKIRQMNDESKAKKIPCLKGEVTLYQIPEGGEYPIVSVDHHL